MADAPRCDGCRFERQGGHPWAMRLICGLSLNGTIIERGPAGDCGPSGRNYSPRGVHPAGDEYSQESE